MDDYYVEPTGIREPTICECCGNTSRKVWGLAYRNDIPTAAYFVEWTENSAKHSPNIDLLIGTWGDDQVNDKRLVSWLYNPTHDDGGSFMVIDGATRPAAESDLCDQALTREEVIGDSALMEVATGIIDAIWLHDDRIRELKVLARDA